MREKQNGATALSNEHTMVAQIEREVAVLLRRAEMVQASRPANEQLLRSAYLLLSALEVRGPVGVAALADAMQVDVSTVSRQILPLERQELVSRKSSPSDGRMSLIEITPEGVQQLAQTRQRRHDVYQELLREWSEPDRTAFAGYLTRLNCSLSTQRFSNPGHRQLPSE